MIRLRQDALPFEGSSHRFVGADHGDDATDDVDAEETKRD